ncbi:MAG: hypothetical protein AB1449_00050 [Chloroflexota bacterium]
MLRLSTWAVRASLLYLRLGFTFGALMLAQEGIPFSPLAMRLLPVHVEVLFLGWTAQLALGVAFWILPRFAHGPARRREAAWLAFALLNLGVWAAAIGAVWAAARGLLVVGRAAEAAAAAALAFHAWPRVERFGA